MSLLKQIKDDQLQARVNKDKVRTSLLTTLYSEAVNIGKNNGNRETTDMEVVAVIRKFIKGVQENIAYAKTPDSIDQFEQEVNILNNYLPDQLSDTELSQYLDIVVGGLTERSMKQMGSVMGELSRKYPGQYDGALASKLVKEKLSV